MTFESILLLLRKQSIVFNRAGIGRINFPDLIRKRSISVMLLLCGGYNYNLYPHCSFHFLLISLTCRSSAIFNISSHFTAFCIHTVFLELCPIYAAPYYSLLRVCCHASSRLKLLTHNNVIIWVIAFARGRV